MSLLMYTLKCIADAILTPPLVFILITLLIILYFKNKKIEVMQKMIIGGSVNSCVELTLSQFVLGTIGGAIASVILTICGVNFGDSSGIQYLFLTSIILMFIKPKFICFSYSAAVLGLISIFFRISSLFIPQFKNNNILNIDILYLIMFIGVLHIIEGALVMLDGDRGAIPVFTEVDGKILGGYAFKRYWVLPIAIIIGSMNSFSGNSLELGAIAVPKWWPLVQSSSGISTITATLMAMVPFYAMLGYSTITFTRNKREKAICSGIYIFIYGMILVLVAQIARFRIYGETIALLLMPAMHEIMMKMQRKDEEKRTPKFVSDEDGLVILDISTNSQLKPFGVQVGSKILSINDNIINSESEIYPILKVNLYKAIIKVIDENGIIIEFNYTHKKNSRLGISVVPRKVKNNDKIQVNKNSFKKLLEEIKRD